MPQNILLQEEEDEHRLQTNDKSCERGEEDIVKILHHVYEEWVPSSST